MNDYIYLDNAASMQTDGDMIERFVQYAREYFPNPEAEHAAGRNCRKELVEAGKRAALALTGSEEYEIIWTASATEAMNVALSCPELIGRKVLTSRSEHPSLVEPILAQNLELIKVNIRHDGIIDLDDLDSKLSSDVSAVVLHHVQNETGAMQNLVSIRELIDRKAPGALFISDTVQSIGKVNIPWQEAKVDLAFIGGHKLGVSCGGAVVFNLSGKQKKSVFLSHVAKLRSNKHAIGRVDPPVALTLADAVESVEHHKLSRFDKVSHLNFLLRKYLEEGDVELKFLLRPDESSPYIVALMIPSYQGQVLVRMLGAQGVMVSEGSACEAASEKVSPALLAMGISEKLARSVIRVSFGFFSDESDVNAFVASLKDVLQDY